MRPPLPEEIFSVADTQSFEKMALEIFRFQAHECPVYRQYINLLGIDPQDIDNILTDSFPARIFFQRSSYSLPPAVNRKRSFSAAAQPVCIKAGMQ